MAASDDMRTQEALTRQITQNLSGINVALTDQLRIQALLNNAARGGVATAREAGQITDAALRDAGVQMASLNATTATLNTTTVDGVALIGQSTDSLNRLGSGVVGTFTMSRMQQIIL